MPSHIHSVRPLLDVQDANDASVNFFELVNQVSQYVAFTSDVLHDVQMCRDSRPSGYCLASETLSSTRQRAKQSLDALARFSRATTGGRRRFQIDALTEALAEYEAGVGAESGTKELWDTISSTDAKIERAIQQHQVFEPDVEEPMGQLLAIFVMMRRACSYVLDVEAHLRH